MPDISQETIQRAIDCINKTDIKKLIKILRRDKWIGGLDREEKEKLDQTDPEKIREYMKDLLHEDYACVADALESIGIKAEFDDGDGNPVDINGDPIKKEIKVKIK